MTKESQENKYVCRLCGSLLEMMVKKSNIDKNIDSTLFKITDKNYGITGDLFLCGNCGLLQCPNLENVIEFYKSMQDEQYESTRDARILQAEKILDTIFKYKKEGRILDIGAGSGIFVESALKRGYAIQGLEPSKWLFEQAHKRNLPVYNELFPSDKFTKKYDAIALLDVVEHVEDPVNLLKQCYLKMLGDGILIITTPDINSICAKIMGNKWWHFRAAHISYFDKETINLLVEKTGFKIIKIKRAKWYFPLFYL
ncbi:class I SAM-dependent methyltransferase, partial [bacterium]